jgi:hypothetical protein
MAGAAAILVGGDGESGGWPGTAGARAALASGPAYRVRTREKTDKAGVVREVDSQLKCVFLLAVDGSWCYSPLQ